MSAADDAVAGLVASLPEPDAASTRTPRISRQKAAESDSKDDRAAAPRRRTRDDAKAGQVAADLFDELDIAPADDQPRHRDDAADSGMMRRRRRTIEPRERDQQNDTVRDLDDILATLPVQNANADAPAAPVVTVIIEMTTSANSPAATVATALTVPTARPRRRSQLTVATAVTTATTTVASAACAAATVAARLR